ncbi:MAG: hypothetical protein WB791_10840 [Waddliaceae bacterium]
MAYIVLLDDGSFSGLQLYQHCKKILSTLEKIHVKVQVHVIVAYTTNRAKELISSLNKKCVHIYTSAVIPTLEESFSQEDLEKIKRLFWRGFPEKEQNKKAGELGLVWWDHKVPNSKSFPLEIAEGQIRESEESYPFIPDIKEPYKNHNEEMTQEQE